MRPARKLQLRKADYLTLLVVETITLTMHLAFLLLLPLALSSPVPRAPVATLSGRFALEVTSSNKAYNNVRIGLDQTGLFTVLKPAAATTSFALKNGELTTSDRSRKVSATNSGVSPGGVLKKILWVPYDAIAGVPDAFPEFSATQTSKAGVYTLNTALGRPCVKKADPTPNAIELYYKPEGSGKNVPFT